MQGKSGSTREKLGCLELVTRAAGGPPVSSSHDRSRPGGQGLPGLLVNSLGSIQIPLCPGLDFFLCKIEGCLRSTSAPCHVYLTCTSSHMQCRAPVTHRSSHKRNSDLSKVFRPCCVQANDGGLLAVKKELAVLRGAQPLPAAVPDKVLSLGF